jgi:hypothetical protein
MLAWLPDFLPVADTRSYFLISQANRGSSLFLFTPVESGTKEGSTGGSVAVAW